MKLLNELVQVAGRLWSFSPESPHARIRIAITPDEAKELRILMLQTQGYFAFRILDIPLVVESSDGGDIPPADLDP